MKDSSISSGSGNDDVEISSVAEGESSYKYTNFWDYKNNYSSSSDGSWKSEGKYQNGYSYGYGNGYWGYNRNYNTENASQRESQYESSYKGINESSYQYENSNTRRFGTAIGSESSSINLGEGNNSLNIEARGGESAKALINSDILTGSGVDLITINAIAEGINGYAYKRSNLGFREYSSSHDRSYDSEYEYSYNNSYSRYGRTSGYHYDTTGTSQSQSGFLSIPKRKHLWL